VRLTTANLHRLPQSIARFDYDRQAQATGIVHLGIGAFHRAHQAWYTDRAMAAGDRDWAITGVSLRSGDVAQQMNPQDGLFTVTEKSAAGESVRLVGSVREVLLARQSPMAVASALIAPSTSIVSLTITEKGYCRKPDGALDHDLAVQPGIYTLLADALRQRHRSNCGGLTLLSCDNLADNGAQLARLMSEYLERHAPDVARWFETECACPGTMVDRIVPATTDADRDTVATLLGELRDEAAVVTEPFSQWVVEDRFAGPRPRWEAVGAQLVSDVAPYEAAKLRMLNGAHSALAYLGLARGYNFVHEAIADPELRSLVDGLMRQEAAPTIAVAPGQNLDRYADDLIKRFANPALNHRLAQIAIDGSQKIPQRWLATLAAQQQAGRSCPAILTALAGWLRHVRGDNGVVNDPRAVEFRAAWASAGEHQIVGKMFGSNSLVSSDWQPTVRDIEILAGMLREVVRRPLTRST
jgi:fructuronate reductase